MTIHTFIVDGKVYQQADDYEQQYRLSADYLNGKYHNQTTRLKNIPLPLAESGTDASVPDSVDPYWRDENGKAIGLRTY